MKPAYRTTLLCAMLSGLVLIGCRPSERVTRASQLKNHNETGTIKVLMKDSTLYSLEYYELRDSVLLGSGYSKSIWGEKAFSGQLNLRDMAYVEAPHSSLIKDIAKLGVAVFFAGSLISYVGDVSQGLSVREEYKTVTIYTGPTGGGGGGSCPHIYTADEEGEHFESETFAGAVFKGAERVAFDALTYAKPKDGRISLRITNENPETEYTNEMKLLSVECPASALVLPDGKGAMHTISRPQEPMSCVDYLAHDQLDRVLRRDGRFWESDLETKDFTKETDLRDGLVLTFSKPVGATTAKIIVDGSNTKLALFAFEQIFTLKGDNRLHWYQQLETNKIDRMKFIKFMLREGMLRVKVWRVNRWEDQATLFDVGPVVVKPQVAVLDICGIEGSELKVKLDATTDLWRIDQVSVDYTPDLPLSVRELVPVSAITEDGSDAAGLLSFDDDKYYTMLPGQHADVVFELPKEQAGMQRAFVVKTKGYYHQWFSSHGTDNVERVERILTEPLYGSREFLPLWKLKKSSY